MRRNTKRRRVNKNNKTITSKQKTTKTDQRKEQDTGYSIRQDVSQALGYGWTPVGFLKHTLSLLFIVRNTNTWELSQYTHRSITLTHTHTHQINHTHTHQINHTLTHTNHSDFTPMSTHSYYLILMFAVGRWWQTLNNEGDDSQQKSQPTQRQVNDQTRLWLRVQTVWDGLQW
jgi:hypothetical protein